MDLRTIYAGSHCQKSGETWLRMIDQFSSKFKINKLNRKLKTYRFDVEAANLREYYLN